MYFRPTYSTSGILSRNNLLRTTKLVTPARTTTTTTTTTTQAPVLEVSEDEGDGEEDPRIIKELIELIKKAGGLEQLEKQFNFRSDDSSDGNKLLNAPTTSSTDSKSLYQRVLNKALALTQNKRQYEPLLRPPSSRATTVTTRSTTSTTAAPEPKASRPQYNSVFRNSRPGPQNDGIDTLPEFEGTLKEKPKYVTLVRQRNNNVQAVDDSDEPTSIENESKEQDSSDPVLATEKPTPNYVNTNRLRSLGQAVNVVEINDATEPPAAQVSPTFKYTNLVRQKTSSTTADEPSPVQTETVESSTSKYKVIERTRVTPITTEDASRYKLVGEDDEFSESPIITGRPFVYETITREPNPSLAAHTASTSSPVTTSAPTSSVSTNAPTTTASIAPSTTSSASDETATEIEYEYESYEDEAENTNAPGKEPETVFIITKPLPTVTTRKPSTTRRVTTTTTEAPTSSIRTRAPLTRRRRPETTIAQNVEVNEVQSSTTTRSRRRPSYSTGSEAPRTTRTRGSSRRTTLTRVEDEVETTLQQETPSTRARLVPTSRSRPTYARPVTRSTQRSVDEDYPDIQSSTVYAPRPFLGSRSSRPTVARVVSNDLDDNLEPSTQRTQIYRGRGNARFRVPSRLNSGNDNSKSSQYVRRRGPSKAYTEESGSSEVDTTVGVSTSPRPETSRNGFTFRSRSTTERRTTGSPVQAEDKSDEGPLPFLVPDRAINPNSRFSLSAGFNTAGRKNEKSQGAVVEELPESAINPNNRFTLTSGFRSGNRPGETTPRAIVDEVFEINTDRNFDQFGGITTNYGEEYEYYTKAQPFPSVADIKEDTVILTLGGQLAVASPAQNSLQQRINEELAKISGVSDEADTLAPYSVTISSLTSDGDASEDTILTRARYTSSTEPPRSTRLFPTRTKPETVSVVDDESAPTPKPTSTRRRIPTRSRGRIAIPTSSDNLISVEQSTLRTAVSRRPFDRYTQSTQALKDDEEQITQTVARLLTSGVPSSLSPETYSTISNFFTTEAIPITDFVEDIETSKVSATTPTTTTTTEVSNIRGRRIKKIRRTRPTSSASSTTATDGVRDNEPEKTSAVYTARRRPGSNRNRIEESGTSSTAAPPSRTRGTIKRLVRKRPASTRTTAAASSSDSNENLDEVDDLDINIDNSIQKQSTSGFSDPSEFSRPTRRFPVQNQNAPQVENRPRPSIRTGPRFPPRTTVPPKEEEIEDTVVDDNNEELNFAVPDKDIISSVVATRPTRFPSRPNLRPANRFSLARQKPGADLNEITATGQEEVKTRSGQTIKVVTTPKKPEYRRKRPSFSRTTTSTETPLQASTKRSNLFTRTRVRNYGSRGRPQESENELEQVTENYEDTGITTLFDEAGNAFTISGGKLTTLGRPFSKPSTEGTTIATPTTTIKHVFAIDEDDEASSKSPGDTAEEISKKLEKLVEINIIEEINTRSEKVKVRNRSREHINGTSEVTLEKLPSNHKAGEISRLSIVRLLQGHDASTTLADEIKKGRILSSDAIFKTETSTIPLERLFELERQAKELRDATTTETSPVDETVTPLYLADSDAADTTIQEVSTLPSIITNIVGAQKLTAEIDPNNDEPTFTSTIDPNEESSGPSATVASVEVTSSKTPADNLLSLLRPDDKDPLVISIANLDSVTLKRAQKSPLVSDSYTSQVSN